MQVEDNLSLEIKKCETVIKERVPHLEDKIEKLIKSEKECKKKLKEMEKEKCKIESASKQKYEDLKKK